MRTIHATPAYLLEADITRRDDLVTLDLYVTYPQAQNPHRVRKAQFTLPPSAVRELAACLLDSVAGTP